MFGDLFKNLIQQPKEDFIDQGDLVTDGNRIGLVHVITTDPYDVLNQHPDRLAAYVVFTDGQLPATDYWYSEDIMHFWKNAATAVNAEASTAA